MTTCSYYDILFVPRQASLEDIKRSYRKLALQWHPDKNQSEDAVKTFQQISEAYHVLSNEQLRKEYDSSRESFRWEEWVECIDPVWSDFLKTTIEEISTPFQQPKAPSLQEVWSSIDKESIWNQGSMALKNYLFKKLQTPAIQPIQDTSWSKRLDWNEDELIPEQEGENEICLDGLGLRKYTHVHLVIRSSTKTYHSHLDLQFDTHICKTQTQSYVFQFNIRWPDQTIRIGYDLLLTETLGLENAIHPFVWDHRLGKVIVNLDGQGTWIRYKKKGLRKQESEWGDLYVHFVLNEQIPKRSLFEPDDTLETLSAWLPK